MRIFAFVIGAAMAAAVSSPALACKCANSTRAQALAGADAVFEGRVVAVRREGARVRATVTVERAIKGRLEGSVDVSTPAKGVACGYRFAEGARLTIVASLYEGAYRTNQCLMRWGGAKAR